MMTFT